MYESYRMSHIVSLGYKENHYYKNLPGPQYTLVIYDIIATIILWSPDNLDSVQWTHAKIRIYEIANRFLQIYLNFTLKQQSVTLFCIIKSIANLSFQLILFKTEEETRSSAF